VVTDAWIQAGEANIAKYTNPATGQPYVANPRR
jgi:hypothetical protein